jgi:hypothetical protein
MQPLSSNQVIPFLEKKATGSLLHKPSPESSGINLIYPHRVSISFLGDSIDTVAEELRAISIYLYTIPPVRRHSKVVYRLAIKLLCPQTDWIHTAARSGKTNRDGGLEKKRKSKFPPPIGFTFFLFLFRVEYRTSTSLDTVDHEDEKRS